MAVRKILIFDGHPEPDPGRFGHALADVHAKGAARDHVRRLKFANVGIAFGFRSDYRENGLPSKPFSGRSPRVVLTMGMPVFFRPAYGARSAEILERDTLKFVDIRPIGRAIIGAVEAGADRRRERLGETETLEAAGE